jgi:Asp/Glu/hydantoin racemase
MGRDCRIVIVGPGPAPAPGDGLHDGLHDEVLEDLVRLARPGITVEYRFAGGGPGAITSHDDALAAAPFVAAAVVRAALDGGDAIVVDCTDDPGLADARRQVGVPVIGAGEALREAIAGVDGDVEFLTGDTLRATPLDALLAGIPPGAVVALGGTGWSHVADALSAAGHRVLDPLPLAVDLGVRRAR